jgi:hypothetical protein
MGEFPPDLRMGEDTVYNRRCVEAGATIAFDPGAQISHRNLTGLREYLHHNFLHGRGLFECVRTHGLESRVGPGSQPKSLRFLRVFVSYPLLRWWRGLGRVSRGRPRSVPFYMLLSPLIWAGLWAASAGAWSAWRSSGGRG